MVTLLILDGFGLRKTKKGNAIKISGTPNLKKLSSFPTTVLRASGTSVGLIPKQMGNSEVGHLNLGAGRVIYQALPQINNAIKDKTFFKNPALVKTMEHVLKNNSNLHILGLLSDGGVHSHINHLFAICQMAKQFKIKNVYFHALSDGRDTDPQKGVEYVKQFEDKYGDYVKINTIGGRVYAMDRERRWDRIKKAYDAIVNGVADHHATSATQALKESYARGLFDEFVEPVIVGNPTPLNDGDGFIFYNYRTDRTIEITSAITNQNGFDHFETKKFNDLCFCCMTEYSSDFKGLEVAYPPEVVDNNLSHIISDAGYKQFHVSETTKYAHVTFFFNGTIEKAYKGEDRKLIDSVDVQNFAVVPAMRAYEITDAAIKAIKSKKYEFVLINLSNPDMIGHTGNLDAAIKSIDVIDECANKIAQACLEIGEHCIITADHGNAEEMIDEKGDPMTAHTTNPVPLILVSEKYKNVTLSRGKLANVAPTVLKIMGLPIPDYMEKPLF